MMPAKRALPGISNSLKRPTASTCYTRIALTYCTADCWKKHYLLSPSTPPPQVVSSFSKDNHAQSGSYQRIDYRVTHSQVIHFASLFNCALLSHGGLILSRKLALQYPHDPSIADKQVANYEMISRMLYKGIVFSIIPEVLYLHRTPQDHFSSSMEVIDRRQALLRISNQLLWQFSGVELSPSQHGLLQLLFSKDTPVSDIRESLRNLSKLASRYIIQEQMDRNARNEMYTWRLQWRLQLFLQLLLRGSWTHRTFVLIHLAKRPHYFFYVETWRKTGLRLLWFLNRFALWKKIGTLKTRSHKSDKIYGE